MKGKGTDLVPAEKELTTVADVRVALKDASVEDIKEIHDRAIAIQAYAKAKENRDQYLRAGEVKLWAERAAGEVRRGLNRWPRGNGRKFDYAEAQKLRTQGLTYREIAERLDVSVGAVKSAGEKGFPALPEGMSIAEFEKEMGISNATAFFWETLARIPEERFQELIAEALERDTSLTAGSIARRDGRGYQQRLEPGIYQLRDGRLFIRWMKDKVVRQRTLNNGDITEARKELAKARGTLKEPGSRAATTIGDAYSLVRRALQALDRSASTDLEPEAKAAVNQAISHLHKAEDQLVIASNRPKVGK